MFWADIRALPVVELNCALIKVMLEESRDEYEYNPPDDEFVEELTMKIERFIAINLNKGLTVSIYTAFTECC
jgi:hypothetical protein